MKQIRVAIEDELRKMTAGGRRVVFLVTTGAAVVFGAFLLYILGALATGALRFDAVVVTLPIVAICALWFGWIAVIARASRR